VCVTTARFTSGANVNSPATGEGGPPVEGRVPHRGVTPTREASRRLLQPKDISLLGSTPRPSTKPGWGYSKGGPFPSPPPRRRGRAFSFLAGPPLFPRVVAVRREQDATRPAGIHGHSQGGPRFRACIASRKVMPGRPETGVAGLYLAFGPCPSERRRARCAENERPVAPWPTNSLPTPAAEMTSMMRSGRTWSQLDTRVSITPRAAEAARLRHDAVRPPLVTDDALWRPCRTMRRGPRAQGALPLPGHGKELPGVRGVRWPACVARACGKGLDADQGRVSAEDARARPGLRRRCVHRPGLRWIAPAEVGAAMRRSGAFDVTAQRRPSRSATGRASRP